MKIIVIRHAATNFNAKHLINGQHDDGLSPEGLLQLPELVEKLKSVKFTSIYSSPLKRALQTAQPIASNRGLDINQDSRLMEVNFGSFTSKNWESMRDVFGMSSKELLNTYEYDLRPYGGESSVEVKARIESFLDDLSRHTNETPVLVTHGGIIRWLYFLLGDQKIVGQPNASIHVFNTDN